MTFSEEEKCALRGGLKNSPGKTLRSRSIEYEGGREFNIILVVRRYLPSYLP